MSINIYKRRCGFDTDELKCKNEKLQKCANLLMYNLGIPMNYIASHMYLEKDIEKLWGWSTIS